MKVRLGSTKRGIRQQPLEHPSSKLRGGNGASVRFPNAAPRRTWYHWSGR